MEKCQKELPKKKLDFKNEEKLKKILSKGKFIK